MSHGFFRSVVALVVKNYLDCGNLKHGFARIRCPECSHEYILAFSCRGRWFCPSCHQKKAVQFSTRVQENVLFPVLHRQYVFSILKLLREFFLYDRKLLGQLSKCASRSLTEFLRISLSRKEGIPGVIIAIQTFGDYARWHPHLHALVADGLFTERGYFHVMPETDLKQLAELFRAHVLKMLKKEGLIDDTLITKLLAWRHTSRFSVHNKVRIKPDDHKGREHLLQYIVRNPFSLSKLEYVESTGAVLYRSGMSHGKNKRNFKVFDPLTFIADITQHIPDKLFQLIRYYGWYSNRMRGDRLKASVLEQEENQAVNANPALITISDYRPRPILSPLWRECIRKQVIRQTLEHLGVYHDLPDRQRAPPAEQTPTESSLSVEPVDDGWPLYEEPWVHLFEPES